MIQRVIVLAALAVLAMSIPVSAGQMMPGNIMVNECVPNEGSPSQSWVGPWGGMYAQTGTPSTLTIHYINEAPKTASSIEFGLLANNRLIAAVRDKGKFSTGAKIKHVFGISPNVFPIGTAFTFCVPLRIKYADGSVLTNPKAPAI
ncbi:MAG TPA: hypothetical protein VGX02_02075 [Candidatus Eremiobacteraceae bacterium]|nr:hypothetical protein [Candidatus Eremiobacteraceae bacterium]